MTRFGDGLAVDPDLLGAAERATADALAPLGGRRPDLVCVFVCTDDPDLAARASERVAAGAGAGAMVGCSAGGVLADGRGVEHAALAGAGAVSVWAGVLPGVRVRPFVLDVVQAEDSAAVVGLPDRDGDDFAVLLADPYSFPADRFLARANDTLPGLRFAGGLAAGLQGPGSTRLFADGRVRERGAVGVLLGGVEARTVVSQGCRPVGPPMTVTGAQGNVLTGLAGEPALQRVQSLLAHLPPDDQQLAAAGLHLGLAMDEYADEHERGDFLVRGILGVERATGGLVVGDLVEVGRTVRLHVRDAQAADDDLHALLPRAGDVGGALLFSCNGRGAHLFGPAYGGADHDPSVVRSALAGSAVAGFFAGGEFGAVGGRNHLHGFTASLLAFPG